MLETLEVDGIRGAALNTSASRRKNNASQAYNWLVEREDDHDAFAFLTQWSHRYMGQGKERQHAFLEMLDVFIDLLPYRQKIDADWFDKVYQAKEGHLVEMMHVFLEEIEEAA